MEATDGHGVNKQRSFNMQTPLYYLAGPYSGTNYQRRQRLLELNRLAGELFKRNFLVFSPISHCHDIADIIGLPLDYNFWREYNRRMLQACDGLIVACMPSWQKSKGVAAELFYAISINISIKYLNPLTLELTDDAI